MIQPDGSVSEALYPLAYPQIDSVAYRQSFTVRAEHIALLRIACVVWDSYGFGAPCIDPYRPYGNSVNVYANIAKALGIAPDAPTQILHPHSYGLHDDDYLPETRQRLRAFHVGTAITLQIWLTAGSIEPGVYVSNFPCATWHLDSEKVSQGDEMAALVKRLDKIARPMFESLTGYALDVVVARTLGLTVGYLEIRPPDESVPDWEDDTVYYRNTVTGDVMSGTLYSGYYSRQTPMVGREPVPAYGTDPGSAMQVLQTLVKAKNCIGVDILYREKPVVELPETAGGYREGYHVQVSISKASEHLDELSFDYDDYIGWGETLEAALCRAFLMTHAAQAT